MLSNSSRRRSRRFDGVVQRDTPRRSRVTSVTVNFDSFLDVDPPVTGDPTFSLVRQSDGLEVQFKTTKGSILTTSSITLSTFTGTDVTEFGSLADGRYTLTIFAKHVKGDTTLDGNNDGTFGDNYVLGSNAAPLPPNNIFRCYGDSDGDGDVDNTDFLRFRSSSTSNTAPNYLPTSIPRATAMSTTPTSCGSGNDSM